MRRMDSAQANMQIHSNEYVSPGLGRRPGTLATVGLALFSCCCVTVLLLTRTWAEPRDLMVVHCRENSSASQNTPAATSCPRHFFRSEETGQCVSCDLRGATDMAEAACRKIPAARKRLLVNPSLRRREGQVALCGDTAVDVTTRAAFLIVGQVRVLTLGQNMSRILMLNAIQSFGALPSVFAAMHADSEEDRTRARKVFASEEWTGPHVEHTQARIHLTSSYKQSLVWELEECGVKGVDSFFKSGAAGKDSFYKTQTQMWWSAAKMALAHEKRTATRFDWCARVLVFEHSPTLVLGSLRTVCPMRK